jgi:hypothetical protein
LTLEDQRRAFRIARGILATLVLLCGASTYYLWQRYADNAPSFANLDSGQVHELYANGMNVYLTRQQQYLLYGLAAATAACLAGAVALDAFAPGKEASERESDGVKFP